MSIFLLGFMGSGKTYWGEKLANHLGFDFVDTDEVIQKSEKMSIQNIFQSKGEDYFRGLEEEFIVNYSRNNEIVSVGGGLPIFNQNMSKLNKKGITVFIEESFDVCYSRVRKTERPLVDVNDEIYLLELYKKRLPIYKESKFKITSPKSALDFIKVLN